ncbi:MAG: type VI secretion system baseplate subunit TssG [Acidobacteria bacterium]|nr:type VI secretion system baseplate subunit TssG [Acidobacteriota bacterium]
MENILREEAPDFDFFQAVRLLTRLLRKLHPVGRFSDPGTEAVRFGAAPNLGFPPSQIARLDWAEDSQPQMDVNFMGLTGPQGLLPLNYTLLIRERLRARDSAMRAFLDIFNHRAISLFFRAWEKHHFTVGYERGEEDALSPHLMDLIGMGTPGLAGRQAVSDEALIFRCGLVAAHARSASGLRALLMDYFDVPVEIEQFIGRWHPIDRDTQCCFTESGSDSEKLGFGTVVGDEIWDQQSGVRIRLGPLTLKQYLEFLPDGSAHQPLRALVRFFVGNELDCEVQLVLKKEEAPICELGADSATAPRLGWLTWARTAPMPHDPDDSILSI